MPVSANTIRFKFPEFKAVDPENIELAIQEASRSVDDTWLPGDRDLALMYLTAHYLMVSISRAESASGQQISSERLGDITVSYATPQQPTEDKPSDLTTTPYGTRYLQLTRLNFPAVAVI